MTEDKLAELDTNILIKDNEMLKSNCFTLKQSLINLEAEYSHMKVSYNILQSREPYYRTLEASIKEKDEQILQLQIEIEALNAKIDKDRLDNELQYEREVNQVKYFYENSIAKVENANRIEKQSKHLYNRILELEDTLRTYETEEKKRFRVREVEFEKELASVKKKMLNYVREGQQNSMSKAAKQRELHLKLNKLHSNELLNELAFQSEEIESLLKQRDLMEKLVNELRNDIKVHVEVERALTEKNMKYNRMVKTLTTKMSIDTNSNSKGIRCNKAKYTFSPMIASSNKTPRNFVQISTAGNNMIMPNPNHSPITNTNTYTNNSPIKIKSQLSSVSLKSNPKMNFSLSRNDLGFQANKNNINEDQYSSNKNIFYKELISLRRKCEKLKLKNRQYVLKYESKTSIIHQIFTLLEEALDKIYNDPQFTQEKNVLINIEDFKLNAFNSMSLEQRYAAVVLIINYLLPFINSEISNTDRIKDRLDEIKTKFIFTKSDFGRTFSSLADSKTTNQSTKQMQVSTITWRNMQLLNTNSNRASNQMHHQFISDLQLKNKNKKKHFTYGNNSDSNNCKKLYSLLKISI